VSWIQDINNPKSRLWEEFYRNRWQHDRVVRSTHGVNCTGGCSWMVYVKDGIVTWELQATDYPALEGGLPPYEPRGCQRGISFSWYLYSPIRVKYPYVRGRLMDLWHSAQLKHKDPVEAWASIVEDLHDRESYQVARGKGGFRRSNWEEVLEIIAASTIYTIKKYGPDRVVGFSPIPAMSMLSHASGNRFLQLLGGVSLSFYDWYSDLPPASPEVFGEQTDVCESADWYNSKFIAIIGSNLNMTRTPDVHFVSESRYAGAKLVVFSPDFSQVSKYADWWVPVHAGQDGAFWMAVNHVILKEFHHDKPNEYFLDYAKHYTDAPFLVVLEKAGGVYIPGRMLRAGQMMRTKDEDLAEWKFMMWDKANNQPRMPLGTVGFRWQKQKGKWNLELKDGLEGSEIDPQLTFLDEHDDLLMVEFSDFGGQKTVQRSIPVRMVETTAGSVPVTTIYDLLMGQFGVARGLEGDYSKDYDDEVAFTPAWQERFTGVDRETVIQFARQWASTAAETKGKCMIIIGSGVNHWYHNDLIYRAAISTLMLTGCVGRNGGGFNHYVGQEKIAPLSSWSTVAFGLDWIKPPRHQNAPSFHFVHSDQWRYERKYDKDLPSSTADQAQDWARKVGQQHTVDTQVQAVRMGWLPFFPQFNRNPLDLVKQANAEGAKTDQKVRQWVVDQLKTGKLQFSVQDPDAAENWPRVFFMWRGNALNSSAKGQEYFFRHYLGTHSHSIADEISGDIVPEIVWRQPAVNGKMDMVVDINFRMDTSALYSDIILPAATWYEKDDLNSTDLHSFVHPLSAAVPPCWESKSDWEIFKLMAKKVSELANLHLPLLMKDVVATALAHDSPGEVAQPSVRDWYKGECEPIPGATMPNLAVVERDYVNLYNKYISLGPTVQQEGIGVHGIRWPLGDLYKNMLDYGPTVTWGDKKYPAMQDGHQAADVVLFLAPETNGEVSYRAYEAAEEETGLHLVDLAEITRDVRVTFNDLISQPQRVLNSPNWSGIVSEGRAYSAYCQNVERLVPWHTLTGRQHFYLDHEGYLAFGEHLPTFKPPPGPEDFGDLDKSKPQGNTIQLAYLTPHGKWHIHSTYYDNDRMLTLSRGIEPLWINDHDARQIEVQDNDWVEIYNDHGVAVTRAAVSARIPPGICFFYHAPERTLGIPKSPQRGGRRAGFHASPIRARLKPVLMMGGYGQFTFALNYWGPTGANRDTYVLVRKLPGKPQY
jgi:nitrate reductase alpha subunit